MNATHTVPVSETVPSRPWLNRPRVKHLVRTSSVTSLLLAAFLAAPAPPPPPLEVGVDPRVELMCLIFRLYSSVGEQMRRMAYGD